VFLVPKSHNNKKQNSSNKRGRARASRPRNSSGINVTREPRTPLVNAQQMGVHRFKRRTSQAILLNQSLGWNSATHDLEFAVTLNTMIIYQAGVSTYTPAFPNVTEFSNLFLEYRITKLSISMYYTNNVSSNNTPGTCLPIIIMGFDPDDTATVTLANMLEYQGSKVFQLGLGVTPEFVCKPRPLLTAGGVASVVSVNPWISTNFVNIPYLGIKLVQDPSISTNVALGAVNFYFEMEFECRGVY
jgi:hypothetical protein